MDLKIVRYNGDFEIHGKRQKVQHFLLTLENLKFKLILATNNV